MSARDYGDFHPGLGELSTQPCPPGDTSNEGTPTVGPGKGVEKHEFQQATASSWGCLGSSERPVPIPAGVSRHDSGLLRLLLNWASAEEQPCCLPVWFLSVCPSLLPSPPKRVPSSSCSGECVQWPPPPAQSVRHSHLSTGQGHSHKSPGSGQARRGELSLAAKGDPRKSQALPAVCMGCGGPGDRQQAGRRCFSAEVNGEGWVSWSPRRLLDHSSPLLAIAALKGEQYPNVDPTASL